SSLVIVVAMVRVSYIPPRASWGVLIRRTPGESDRRLVELRLPALEGQGEHHQHAVEGASQLTQRFDSRGHRGETLDLRLIDGAPLPEPALEHRALLVLLREGGQDLRGADRVLRDDDTRRALERRAGQAALVHRTYREGILDDDVLDP